MKTKFQSNIFTIPYEVFASFIMCEVSLDDEVIVETASEIHN